MENIQSTSIPVSNKLAVILFLAAGVAILTMFLAPVFASRQTGNVLQPEPPAFKSMPAKASK